MKSGRNSKKLGRYTIAIRGEDPALNNLWGTLGYCQRQSDDLVQSDKSRYGFISIKRGDTCKPDSQIWWELSNLFPLMDLKI